MEMFAMLESVVLAQLGQLENASAEVREAAFLKFGEIEPAVIHSANAETGVGTLSIIGGLSPKGPSALARFFGFEGTAYADIIKAADQLRADPSVKEIRMVMDTPGGTVAGMDGAHQALVRLAEEKTLIAENHGMIASAGYYLASTAERIEAVSPMVKTGSIGVIVAGVDSSVAMERAGYRKIRIVSSNAPNKQPDPATSAGQDVFQEMVDATERVFIAKIAEGRGLTAEYIAENFGRGAVLIAQDPNPEKPSALSVRMVDEVTAGAFTDAGSSDIESAGPTPFKDLPIIDRPWDGDAAVQRVRRLVGAEDAPNTRYRQAFFWYDSENSSNFGAYKLPFVDVDNGRLVANIRGVNAANGAMSGARGQRVQIPQADRSRVQSHIDRYRDKWAEQKNEESRSADHGEGDIALDTRAAPSGENGGVPMDLNTLKADHPAVFAAAVAVGVDLEHERVEAHLELGTASGDMDLAVSCIKDGKELTASTQAKYMAAGMNKNAKDDRAAESEADLDTSSATDDEDEHDAALAAELGGLLGVETNA